MSDIVERLRDRANGMTWHWANSEEMAKEAAVEIERLRTALREIAACPQKRHRADGDVDVYYNSATMLKIAKGALK